MFDLNQIIEGKELSGSSRLIALGMMQYQTFKGDVEYQRYLDLERQVLTLKSQIKQFSWSCNDLREKIKTVEDKKKLASSLKEYENKMDEFKMLLGPLEKELEALSPRYSINTQEQITIQKKEPIYA
jgi:chromosome segregation ATPase